MISSVLSVPPTASASRNFFSTSAAAAGNDGADADRTAATIQGVILMLKVAGLYTVTN